MNNLYIKILLAVLFLVVLFYAFRTKIHAMHYKMKYQELLKGVVAKDNSFMVEVQRCDLSRLDWHKQLGSFSGRSCEIGLLQLELNQIRKAKLTVNGILDAATQSALISLYPIGLQVNIKSTTLAQNMNLLSKLTTN